MDKFSFLSKKDFEKWNQFICENDNGTVFHLTYLLEPLAHYLKCEFKILALSNASEEIIAGFPFIVKKRMGYFKIIQYPPMIPYYGIVFKGKNNKYISKNQKYEHKIINKFISKLQQKYHYVRISFPPTFNDVRPFIWSNFKVNIGYTYRCSLNKIQNLYNNFDPDIKRRIRKAENSDVIYKNGIDNDQINHFYELQNMTFRKQQLNFALSKKQFTDYINSLNKHDLVNIHTIYYRNIPVASAVVLLYQNVIYYWMAGAHTEYLSEGYNQLNFWKMFQELENSSANTFDFVGASTPSVAGYKATYNFELVPYYLVDKSFTKLMKLMMLLKRLSKS